MECTDKQGVHFVMADGVSPFLVGSMEQYVICITSALVC